MSITLKHMSKSFDHETFAVRETSVSIQEGEFFVLVGPSGCGKSTMLRMIAGLESITAGEIYINGTLANDMPPNKRQISMVFQNYALYPHLTVEENILFGLKVRKIPKKEQKKRCLEACDMLGMTEYLKRKPRELSGGQRQRVALARAVVSQMPICLMDEPLSNLDAKLRGQMRTEIRQLQQKLGITMIYVTHDQVEAMTMADRMMVLKKGEVQQIGKPLDIYNNPANAFVATFIGAPPMNVSNVTTKDGFTLPLTKDITLTSTVNLGEHKEILVGLRPEHIQLEQTATSIAIPAVTKNVEILGNETVMTCLVGDHEWKAKVPGQWNYSEQENITIYVDPANITLFDALASEERIECDLFAKEMAVVHGGSGR
ncbi:ABC transporter ATP-binding protein [Paenalkalicoccus suaedae]|uniref:ABC transporter ATP-binding protein n=1 Tax=Paenalkalicoccus suaedae TaxID=2592382 RepID=A0A859FAT1_9BACI|nr:ABC transporter ATP-binding protein [Paenalkalicoccus suaedae]QKS70077.1 ABC transporter ATP-binding protein [Paenalkalicoccus suaedae]